MQPSHKFSIFKPKKKSRRQQIRYTSQHHQPDLQRPRTRTNPPNWKTSWKKTEITPADAEVEAISHFSPENKKLSPPSEIARPWTYRMWPWMRRHSGARNLSSSTTVGPWMRRSWLGTPCFSSFFSAVLDAASRAGRTSLSFPFRCRPGCENHSWAHPFLSFLSFFPFFFLVRHFPGYHFMRKRGTCVRVNRYNKRSFYYAVSLRFRP